MYAKGQRLPHTTHFFVKFAILGSHMHIFSYVEISIILLKLRISNTFSMIGFFYIKNTTKCRYFVIWSERSISYGDKNFKPSTPSMLLADFAFVPQRRSTTSNAIPCCWQRSLTGSNTSSISLFLSTRVSVKVELRNIRIVFCTSLGSMSGRTSVGPGAYRWEKIINFLEKKSANGLV